MTSTPRDPHQHPGRDVDDSGKDSKPRIGAGIGAGVGAVAGAALGAVAGPPGVVFGGTVGAVAGGLVGGGEGDALTAEETYWRENYRNEPYVKPDHTYDDYLPAYRTGWEARARYPGRSYEEIEPELQTHYTANSQSRLDWADARHATRAAWHRVERAMPGDADSDGR